VRELARGSVAAARNACDLVEDAGLLSGAGRLARAYSLAGLAVEEVGKARSLAALAARFVTRPLSEVAEILDQAQVPAASGVWSLLCRRPSGLTCRRSSMLRGIGD